MHSKKRLATILNLHAFVTTKISGTRRQERTPCPRSLYNWKHFLCMRVIRRTRNGYKRDESSMLLRTSRRVRVVRLPYEASTVRIIAAPWAVSHIQIFSTPILASLTLKVLMSSE